jgi:O-antigen ligase
MTRASGIKTAAAMGGFAVVALVLLAALHRFGLAVIPALGLLAVAVVLSQHPTWALGAVMVPAVLIEDTSEGGLFPELEAFYEQSYGVSPFEALIVIAAVAVALDVARKGRFRPPDPMTVPLLLLVAALFSGLVVGLSNGAPINEIAFTARPLVVLLVLSVVVVNAIRDRTAIVRALYLLAGLVALKAALGLISLLIGQAYTSPGDPSLTYLDPTVNWLTMALVLVLVATLVSGRRPPLWLAAASALSFLSLLLSYRRSFWIGALAGILIVVIIGSGPLRWRTAVPILATVTAAVWLTLGSGLISNLEGPIAERAASLDPSRIEANAQDRYRIGERTNVLADLRENPATGLGLAVGWTGRFPPSLDRPGSRDYVHFTALSWWLKMGLLGLLAYLSLIGTAIWASVSVWRRHDDIRLRLFGLAMAGAVAGLALAEMTGAFVGINLRFSAIAAGALGLLAATLADARSPKAAPSPSRASQLRPLQV